MWTSFASRTRSVQQNSEGAIPVPIHIVSFVTFDFAFSEIFPRIGIVEPFEILSVKFPNPFGGSFGQVFSGREWPLAGLVVSDIQLPTLQLIEILLQCFGMKDGNFGSQFSVLVAHEFVLRFEVDALPSRKIPTKNSPNGIFQNMLGFGERHLGQVCRDLLRPEQFAKETINWVSYDSEYSPRSSTT
jgi:hypothetical protein